MEGGISMEELLKGLIKEINQMRTKSLWKRNFKYYRGFDDALCQINNILINKLICLPCNSIKKENTANLQNNCDNRSC